MTNKPLSDLKADMLTYFQNKNDAPSISTNHILEDYIQMGMDLSQVTEILSHTGFEMRRMSGEKMIARKNKRANIRRSTL